MTDRRPWIARYPAYWPTDGIDYPEIPVPELLRRRTDEFADRTAVVFADRTYTYADLRAYADRTASGLSSLGVERGDHVSICLPNCPAYTFSFYGVLTLGGVTVHTSFMYTEDELERQLSDAEATTLIVLDAHADEAATVIDDTPVEDVVVVPMAAYAPPSMEDFVARANEDVVEERGWTWFPDLVEDAGGEPPRPDIGVDDLASLPYTGGTTGFPKGVRITHRNWVSEAAMTELVDLVAYDADGTVERGEQVVTGLMPMFHVNGNWTANLTAVYNGATVVLYPQFDPGTVLTDIEAYGVTHMHTVPTMITGLLNHPRMEETDFSSLRHVLVASAPVPTETKERFESITGAVTFEGYGQTEVAMGATMEPPDDRREGSCGIPMPGVEVDVVDVDTGESLPPGEVGEIVVRSEHVMDGYWNRPEVTAETVDDEGWLHTGDLGYRDGDWFFYHVDRMDDMIVTSGHNVYPAEVEDVLYEHDVVKDAAVIGVPDDYRGENVAAYIELRDGVEVDEVELEAELDAFCRERLADYKVPREYAFRELPTTDVGKISREDLKEEVG